MKQIARYTAVLLLTLVVGCASTATPQQSVFAAKSGYEVALTAAVAYRALPACTATVKPPCNDPAVVAQLQKAQPAARTALDAAESIVRSPSFGDDVVKSAVTAAQAALAAFTSITSKLRTK
jgi:hypothetical protein